MSDLVTDPRCTAHAKHTGERCKRSAVPGARVCRYHGGLAPQVLNKAAQRLAEQAARRTLADLDVVEPVTDAFGALESLAGEAVALVEVLRGKVAELREIRYESGQGFEQLRAELAVYLQSLTRAESIRSNIVKLDLDSRRVRLREVQVMAVVSALDKVLTDSSLALDPARQRHARELLARALGAPAVLEVV